MNQITAIAMMTSEQVPELAEIGMFAAAKMTDSMSLEIKYRQLGALSSVTKSRFPDYQKMLDTGSPTAEDSKELAKRIIELVNETNEDNRILAVWDSPDLFERIKQHEPLPPKPKHLIDLKVLDRYLYAGRAGKRTPETLAKHIGIDIGDLEPGIIADSMLMAELTEEILNHELLAGKTWSELMTLQETAHRVATNSLWYWARSNKRAPGAMRYGFPYRA